MLYDIPSDYGDLEYLAFHWIDQKEPDDDGDVILSLSGRSVKVSSKVLSLASPVFKRMLTSPFKEGGGECSPANPKVIDLPDDDTHAMVWICYLIHPIPIRLATDLPQSFVERLVLHADKWDCLESISLWTRFWLEQYSNIDWLFETAQSRGRLFPYRPECWGLLRLSFIMGNHEAFWAISRYLTYELTPGNYRDDVRSALRRSGFGEIPHFVRGMYPVRMLDAVLITAIEMMIELGKKPVNNIYARVEALIDQASKIPSGFCQNAAASYVPAKFCHREEQIRHFFSQLWKISVWPKSEIRKRDLSTQGYIDQLDNYVNWESVRKLPSGKQRRWNKPKCRCMPRDIKEEIQTIIRQEGNGWQKGLCLECVKRRIADPEFDYKDGNCRSKTAMEHQKEMEGEYE